MAPILVWKKYRMSALSEVHTAGHRDMLLRFRSRNWRQAASTQRNVQIYCPDTSTG
jgi:hypothetical protein